MARSNEGVDARFLKDSGVETYTGNELILKGCLEAGVHLLTGYPGSPVSEVFEAAQRLAPYLKERGMLAQLANNEALAAARLNGSQQMDLRSVAVMKSVGMNVAADGLATGTLSKTGRQGGAVIVVGDDPWSDTTQVPQDSRRLSDHLLIPVLEPATFQEVKDFIGLGLDLSQHSDLYVCCVMTTNLCDGGASVRLNPNPPLEQSTRHKSHINPEKDLALDRVSLPPNTGRMEQEAYEIKMPALLRRARTLKVNRIEAGKEGVRLGFVTSGVAYSYLRQALLDLGLDEEFPVLKLGLSFPVDPEITRRFLESVDEVVVVEPKRSFIETQVRDLSARLYQTGRTKKLAKIWGKDFPKGLSAFPARHGLNSSVVVKRLVPMLKRWGYKGEALTKEVDLIAHAENHDITVPIRTPTFCGGCPHRDTTSVFQGLLKDLKDPVYMRRKHGRDTVDLLFNGDSGCYSMLYLPPNEPLMHNYSGMGLGGGTGAGIAPFVDNKAIAFIGDGTFFHSGISAVSDAIKNNQDITFIILDNKTTAMTGHQPHPGVEENLMMEKTVTQDIVEVLSGLVRGTRAPVVRVNPEKWDDYREVLEKTILMDGVKFIVADKECGITFHRRRKIIERKEIKQSGYLSREASVHVDQDVCEYCLECTQTTGCPSLTVVETDHGPKIATDETSCVSDGACARVKACPAFEEVTVTRTQAPATLELPSRTALKGPPAFVFEDVWRGYLAGIGGMGVGSLTALMARAGRHEGYFVQFCDKKGMAIRNGGVYSHIIFSKKDQILSPLIPYGKADLLIGVDLVEAARGLDPRFNLRVASRDRTACVVNTHRHPTVSFLMGRESLDMLGLEKAIRANTLDQEFVALDVSDVTRKRFASSLYDNVVMLGISFQRGLLPLHLESIEAALSESFRGLILDRNREAFQLGRDLVVHPEHYGKSTLSSFAEQVEIKEARLRRRYGRRVATGFRAEIDRVASQLKLPSEDLNHIILRFYELVHYENLTYAKAYLDRVLAVAALDSAKFGWGVTKAVSHGLHKCMAIKDEVYVSHLLTSDEKLERDRRRYNVDPARGDKMKHVHFNRPHFNFWGMNFEFDIKTRDWMLRLMRHGKFLRRILNAWHSEEKDFRDWYLGIVDRFIESGRASDTRWLKIFKVTQSVKGYRKVRSPRMAEAKKEATRILADLSPGGQSVPVRR